MSNPARCTTSPWPASTCSAPCTGPRPNSNYRLCPTAATKARASACTPHSNNLPVTKYSTWTTAPTTRSYAGCAAWVNAASRYSPAAGAPSTTSPPAPARSATSSKPHSFSPISNTADSPEVGEITSLHAYIRPDPQGPHRVSGSGLNRSAADAGSGSVCSWKSYSHRQRSARISRNSASQSARVVSGTMTSGRLPFCDGSEPSYRVGRWDGPRTAWKPNAVGRRSGDTGGASRLKPGFVAQSKVNESTGGALMDTQDCCTQE